MRVDQPRRRCVLGYLNVETVCVEGREVRVALHRTVLILSGLCERKGRHEHSPCSHSNKHPIWHPKSRLLFSAFLF